MLGIDSSEAKSNGRNAMVFYDGRRAEGSDNVREDEASFELVSNASNSVRGFLHPLLAVISSCFDSRVPVLEALLTAILRHQVRSIDCDFCDEVYDGCSLVELSNGRRHPAVKSFSLSSRAALRNLINEVSDCGVCQIRHRVTADPSGIAGVDGFFDILPWNVGGSWVRLPLQRDSLGVGHSERSLLPALTIELKLRQWELEQ